MSPAVDPALATQMTSMQVLATILFAVAVAHTFLVSKFQALAHRFPEGSIRENVCHLLGEVEVVFGIWAAVLVACWSVKFGSADATLYLETVNYTEALFVFVIMCMSATRPIMQLTQNIMLGAARLLPGPIGILQYVVILILGPCLGSLITEPAAMTVTALMLKPLIFDRQISVKLRYATLGLLFVNISIGGTFTHFAAPPVLMVAGPWGWDSAFMLQHFGWRASISVTIGTLLTAVVFRRELIELGRTATEQAKETSVPKWMMLTHILFMAAVIMHSHHPSAFVPLFLLFLGWYEVTKEYQSELRLRESLLVGYFLGGLVTLGKLQDWWLKPILADMSDLSLFWGAIALTAVTDNAALTYLGTLVSGMTDTAKFALLAGAVTGGGLTVIANAPNPAGYGILNDSFPAGGIKPLGLFLGALPYTLLAAAMFLI